MHKYFVESTTSLTPSTLLLTLKKEEFSKPLLFQPGQYAAISYKKGNRRSVTRCFSIVSSPHDGDHLQFAMRTKGHYTKSLTKLMPGDEVSIRGPFGAFVVNPQRDQKIVMLAGGIGVTPLISMLKYMTETNAQNKITLFYSNPTQDEVAFADQLKQFQAANKNFQALYFIGDGPTDKFTGYHVEKGRITSEILDKTIAGDMAASTFFICGPPPFMRGMFSILNQKGVSKELILTEAFSQGPNRQTGKIRNWPFNMYLMTAAGVGMAALTITVGDLFKTLPPSSIVDAAKKRVEKQLSSARQEDLDSLVNNLPNDEDGSESDELTRARGSASTNQAAQSNSTSATKTSGSASAKTSTASAPKTSSSSTPTSSSTSSSTTTTTTPTPTPTPTPPPPTCTTTQSGVKVCQ